MSEREQINWAVMVVEEAHHEYDHDEDGNPLCDDCGDLWPCPTKVVLDALDTAETQRDTLRTALIEAQSWLERPTLTSVVPILARIREALEGTT